ncbi:MAG: hypothetical protein Q7J07_01975 [Pelolinea sp.]|nr:hypothetical protein [Pelolinea sp.]
MVVPTKESQTDQHSGTCGWAEFSSAAYQPFAHWEISQGSRVVVGCCITHSLEYLDLK